MGIGSGIRRVFSASVAAILIVTSAPAVFVNAKESNAAAEEETASYNTINFMAEETNEKASLAEVLPYQNTSLSFEERAADLVARMTLEEKAAQTAAKGAPAISRLGVKGYYYWREGIHGVARQGGATSFPSSLAMSNSWDRNLMYEIMDITSTEARGKNNRYDLNYWNPTINLARDPRWGRNEESYGEDPYLTAEIGGNAVKGMQGTDEKYWKTITTLKHYAANNCEGERQRGTSVMNERTLREYYVRAFRDISENFNPGAVMSSYNGTTVYRNGEILSSSNGQKIDYIASSANSYLINDLLRRTYGFDGFVVGDCGAWDNAFGVASLKQKLYPDKPLDSITPAMTVSKIIEAGSSLDCNSGGFGTAEVLNAVKEGLITEDQLDIVVYELFLARMRTGEFDNGAKYQDITSAVIESEESNEKAEEAAEKTWVLLENKNNALPLKNNAAKIAVVGGYANEVILGDYSAVMEEMKQAHLVKPIDGITTEVKKINPNAEVNLIGNISESTPLFNIKSIKLVKGSKEETVDLSSASSVIGMTKSGSEFTNVTSVGTAVIPSVNFKDVTAIKIEAASFTGMPNVNVAIGYGSATQNVANVKINPTENETTYTVNDGIYNGATGGYTDVKDMYIKVEASTNFEVDNYKDSLDDADYIIAYAGTTTADSSESNDRKSIDLPESQSHIQKLCDEYPDKTIVVLQTVGQVNVEGFKDKCAAMLWTSYNGQQQGTALGKILTGAANPSGKLTTTWYTKADLEKMPIGSERTQIDGVDYNITNYELASDITGKQTDYPGRTYQYYKGTPVYPFGYGKSYTSFEYSNVQVSKNAADANDVIQISADVKNNGAAAGEEVVQLYVAAPRAGTGGMPIKQLKNFEKVMLNSGETKKVTFDLDISDVYFFNEETQKNYVLEGEYTAYVGASSADTANPVKFTVSGDIAETLKRVYAIPSGLKLYIATDASGVKPNEPGNSIDAGVSVTLKNDAVITDFENNGITVTYESSNSGVASVYENGIVKAGAAEGVATITVTAAKEGGGSVTTTFPVVTVSKERMADDVKNGYLKQLDDAYKTCPESAYETGDWAKLYEIYNNAKSFVENAVLDDNVKTTVDSAISEMLAIPKIQLTYTYTIGTVNPNVMENNVIDYSLSGIGEYNASETEITGTITKDNPYEAAFQATENGNVIGSPLTWIVEKLDNSSRISPQIDKTTGKLKIYENGVYRVTAADYAKRVGGFAVIYANLQIEAESADNGGGATLDDEKGGASGGLCAGNTAAKWIRFDGVKLDNLASITLRVSQKNAESKLKVSMTPNDNWVIASADAPVTGDWAKWTEVKIPVNENVLKKLTFDEYGCASVYVQTNTSNLDYIRLDYNSGELKAVNLDGGKVSVNTPFDGGVLIGAVYGDDGAVKNINTKEISNGTTELDGFEENDKAVIYAWDGMDTMSPLCGKSVHFYNKPQPKQKKVLYNFSDPAFDKLFVAGAGTLVDSRLGMQGYGGWATGGSGNYKYDGVSYVFTRSLKGGKGEENARKVFFTPDSSGAVTAFFKASDTRVMKIEQDGVVIEKNGINDKTVTIVQANVKADIPVYVYGGGSNKELCGVLFEADKTVEITQPTQTPEPTPPPVLDPFPEDEILAAVPIEFENYVKGFDSGSKKEDLADGNKCVGSTRDGDIFYFGEQNMDNLAEISIYSAQRNDGGNASATIYAVDVSGIDINSADKTAVEKLLTNSNKLGTVNIISDKNWTTYYENRLRFNAVSGSKGLFVKLNTDNKYCGNHDKMTLTYLKPNQASLAKSEDLTVLTAENDNAVLNITGNIITAADKYSVNGRVYTINYNEEYGQNVEFKKLINSNGTFAALIEDKDSGKTDIITSPGGTVWMKVTPTEFAESDIESADFKINDIFTVEDQMYLGCDNGILITMPPCSKCVTLKKVCDFDIKSISYEDGKVILYGYGDDSAELNLNEIRQSDIQADAALKLAEGGALLVDVRSAEEFAQNHIEGSINVPADEFETWIKTRNVYDTIIVYCSSGMRASKAAKTAASLGYVRTYNLGSIDNLIK